jgi:hypothetical protein
VYEINLRPIKKNTTKVIQPQQQHDDGRDGAVKSVHAGNIVYLNPNPQSEK